MRNGRNSLKISKEALLNNSLFFQGIKVPMSIIKPISRSQTCCSLYNNLLFVFGGLNSLGLDDLWICDIDQNFNWKNIRPQCIEKPMGRFGHTVINYRNELYFFGGINCDSSWPKEDLLIYSLSN